MRGLSEDIGGASANNSTTGYNTNSGNMQNANASINEPCDGWICKAIIGVVCLGAGYGIAKATGGKKKKRKRK